MRASAAFIALLMVLSMAAAGLPSAAATDGSEIPLQDGDPAAGSGSCSIPCGYINPILVIDLDGVQGNVMDLAKDEGPITLEGTVTFKFDIVQEGFGLDDPSDPITVELKFIRKPDWVDATPEPRTFTVPISPQYVQADPSDPSNPQAEYRYTEEISVTLEKNSKPIVEDEGYDFSRMGLYARSSESGLYKPAYGYREMRLRPTGYDIVNDPSQIEAVLADVPLDDEDLQVPFHNVALDMDLLSEISLWQPTRMAFKVVEDTSGGVVRHPDMWATVVDHDGNVVYHTGIRHVHSGILELDVTFPDVGRYAVLVTAKPTPYVSQTFWQPVTAAFPVVVERFGTPSFPDAYQARYQESLTTLAADPAAGPDQFEKTIPFPVREGAAGGELTASLNGKVFAAPGSAQPPTFPSRVAVQVLDPDGAVLDEATLDPSSPSASLSFDAATPSDHAVRVVGTGIHPIDYGVGAVLNMDLTVDYDEAPLVTGDNVRHLKAGASQAAAGGVTLSLDGPAEDVAPWEPVSYTASVEGEGAVKDLVVTVAEEDGRIWYTDHVDAASERTLDVPFPRAGRYVVAVSAEPVPGSGARWQAASAAFPVTVGDPASPTLTYPSDYEATFRGSVYQVQADDGVDQYDRYFPFPVFGGATDMQVTVALEAPGAASLTVRLLDGNGSRLDEAEIDAASPEATLEPPRLRSDTYVVHVRGTGAPVAYYTVTPQVAYDDAPVRSNPLFETAGDDAGQAGGEALPLPGGPLAVAALGAAAAGLALVLRARRKEP